MIEIQKIFPENLVKLIFSLPTKGEYKKIMVRPVEKQGEPLFYIEKFTETQAFHENLSRNDTLKFIEKTMVDFKQINAYTTEKEIMVKASKKGKILVSEKALEYAPKVKLTHDRVKNYLLKEGEIVPALVELGVLTTEGKVVSAYYNKFKQINRYIEFIDDMIGKSGKTSLNVVDFGCGKSYLTFVLYHYLTEIKKIQTHIVGLDLKKDVVEHCRKLAKKFGYDGLQFICGDIKDYEPEEKIDLVVSLHACDTATDYALYHAIQWGAEYIFAVPCCQHELNLSMEGGAFSLMQEYGIVKERFAALATDTIRAKLLTAAGYETQLLEFIDIEHSPKNILIRGRKKKISAEKKAQSTAEVRAFLQGCNGENTLYKLMEEAVVSYEKNSIE